MDTRNIILPKLPENLWRMEESLRHAADLIERTGENLRAVSFDFFDTLVWRLVDRPTHVFIETGTRLEQQKLLRPGLSGFDFETLRRKAEFKAREQQNNRNSAREDVTLDEIYDILKLVVTDPPAAAQIEHALECELCQVNPGMADFLRYVRGRGLRVVILSDIYLSSSQLKDILAANQFDSSVFEFILTSSETGACKSSGNLFRRALEKLKIGPGQLLHIGDSFESDVAGGRKAGVMAVHYTQDSNESQTILERERILLGGGRPVFNANSLRLMAARYFQGETHDAVFARTGAFIMGPLMSRFATWACQQFLAGGVRKVGAFMREGDLFAQMLQREADAQGYDLEIKPLFVNRKSTSLASLGPVTADGIITWLQYRVTLTIRRIMDDLGLKEEELKGIPVPLDEKLDSKDKILKLAEYIFRPSVAKRIEANSARERRKVMDYLRPWLEDNEVLGVCDLGYSGSAQMQLKRIFELESCKTAMVGCYLVTHDKAAERVLRGLDVRHFLGGFAKPDAFFRSFIRSPAWLEQSVVAPIGTTLGYERNEDGSVVPVLDETHFDEQMLSGQKAFKEGALLFQSLWLSARASKPALLNGQSEFSRRVLADLDLAARPVLARASAFPLPSEVKHFGALPLDDYYFADSKKTLCSQENRAVLRQYGYKRLLNESDVYWPQATNSLENPRANSDFFSYAKAILYCNPERDSDGVRPDVTIAVRAHTNPSRLRECLTRLSAQKNLPATVDIIVNVASGREDLLAVAREFSRPNTLCRIHETELDETLLDCMNNAAGYSSAPWVMFLDEDALLPSNWEKLLRQALGSDSNLAAVIPQFSSGHTSSESNASCCLLVRRNYFMSSLGLTEGLEPDAGALALLLRLRGFGLQTMRYREVSVEIKNGRQPLSAAENTYLSARWPDFANFLSTLPSSALQQEKSKQPAAPVPSAPPVQPRVTIIIPTYNKLELTKRCLQALASHTPAPTHEIIAVDNNSTDGTADFLRTEEAAGRLRLIFNTDNSGFAKACNQGARLAQGHYLVFLHNDAEVQSNWLGSLFSLAETDPTVAAVGCKLLYPDGTIQHAGIALADCWDHDPLRGFHLFAQEKSELPLANQRRVYQAVTAACMLVRKSYFDQVAGFDEQFWNGYEDVDLCLRFQARGWLTVYEPASVAIHHESQNGADPSRRTPENAERFHRKWLEKASPDVIVDQNGKSRMAPASAMRIYSPPPGKLVSVIILAHNQIRDTQQCLASIEKNTPISHELILVDNGSTDGTGQFFRHYASKNNHARVILNRANLGFAGGNNQGLARARGDAILLLNNDTVVTPGWLERMLSTLDLYGDCGLTGPVSNSISGPQLVSAVNYSSLDQLPKFTAQWSATHAGQTMEVPRLVGFCLLLRRSVLEKIGGLDAQFGSGNFEDDDFCVRAGLAGFKLRITKDSFVHHIGGQTFKAAKIDYRASMERNWILFKAKWAMPAELSLEKGYRLPSSAPKGLALRLPLPEMSSSHTSSLEGRCWTDKTLPDVTPKKSSRQTSTIALPKCALVGHLGEARELVQKRHWQTAWTASMSAMLARPYHPEAWLLLAEIALGAGDAESARQCAKEARELAPGWAQPKQFLKGNLRGNAKLDWVKLPAIPAKAGPPRISVCLIAKNEEQFIGQCLRSVRAVASQIVVVDTGSSDRTVEIAKEHGAEVHHFTWCDDFSAARNAALEHATGDWVLSIDADEELPPGQVENLVKELNLAGVLGYRMPIIDKGREDSGRSFVPRLFRNAPGLFFVGRIHEQAFSSIQVRCQQWGLKHQLGTTPLLHHGYTDEVMAGRNKIERNLRLLQKAVEEMPDEPNLLMSLGLELVRSGKLEAGLDRYWEAFRLLSAMPAAEVTPELRETLLTQLSTHLMAAKRFSDIVQLWQIPFAKSGGLTASQHFCFGAALMELKQPAEAAEQMRQCLDKRTRPVLSPINPEILKAGPHHCLAMCLIAMNDATGAEEAFKNALAADATSRPTRFDVARFQAAQGRTTDALNTLAPLAKENPKDAPVWELGGQIALSRPDHLSFAQSWTAEAVKHFQEDQHLLRQRAEALLFGNDLSHALPCWRRVQPANAAKNRAAVVLCELLVGDLQHHFTSAEEPAISQEAIQWYRQSIRMGAHAFIRELHERMETIRLTLPSFVRVLEAAHRQARQVAA